MPFRASGVRPTKVREKLRVICEVYLYFDDVGSSSRWYEASNSSDISLSEEGGYDSITGCLEEKSSETLYVKRGVMDGFGPPIPDSMEFIRPSVAHHLTVT